MSNGEYALAKVTLTNKNIFGNWTKCCMHGEYHPRYGLNLIWSFLPLPNVRSTILSHLIWFQKITCNICERCLIDLRNITLSCILANVGFFTLTWNTWDIWFILLDWRFKRPKLKAISQVFWLRMLVNYEFYWAYVIVIENSSEDLITLSNHWSN